ncbi:hypothetical protein ACO0RG_000179 [Hanseniaspora osmophila]
MSITANQHEMQFNKSQNAIPQTNSSQIPNTEWNCRNTLHNAFNTIKQHFIENRASFFLNEDGLPKEDVLENANAAENFASCPMAIEANFWIRQGGPKFVFKPNFVSFGNGYDALGSEYASAGATKGIRNFTETRSQGGQFSSSSSPILQMLDKERTVNKSKFVNDGHFEVHEKSSLRAGDSLESRGSNTNDANPNSETALPVSSTSASDYGAVPNDGFSEQETLGNKKAVKRSKRARIRDAKAAFKCNVQHSKARFKCKLSKCSFSKVNKEQSQGTEPISKFAPRSIGHTVEQEGEDKLSIVRKKHSSSSKEKDLLGNTETSTHTSNINPISNFFRRYFTCRSTGHTAEQKNNAPKKGHRRGKAIRFIVTSIGKCIYYAAWWP